jgi:two-component system sensor histidine kinase EvgS
VKEASLPGAVWGMNSAPIKSTLKVLSLLFSVLLSQSIHAAQSLPFGLMAPFTALEPFPFNEVERRALDARGKLRVGIAITDYEPVDITTDRNRYQGISADYLSLIGSRLKLPVDVVGFVNRNEAVTALQRGSIDILTSAGGFERGLSGLAFSREYLPDRSVVVGRGVDHRRQRTPDYEKVVVVEGYADPKALHAAYPRSEIILAPSLYSALGAVHQGEADVLVGNEVIIRSYMALRPYLGLQIKFESSLPLSGFTFAVRDDQQQLLSWINTALGSVEPSVHREVLGRWTTGLGSDVAMQRIRLTRAEIAWTRKHPVVTVATGQHPPYIYKDINGQWVGLNIDVLARISRMTGLQFVHKEVSSTQESLALLSAAQAEMNTTLAESAERRTVLDFTYAFGGNNWVFVLPRKDKSPSSLAELSGRRLALPVSHVLEGLIRRDYPQIKLIQVANYAAARRLVESGEADITIQNEAGAYLSPPGKLKLGNSVGGRWSPDRFSVIKSQPHLLDILNKALEQFPVVEMRAIRMKWLGAQVPQASVWSRVPSWLYWVLTLALLIGLISLIWSARLKSQVRQRLLVQEAFNDQLAFKHALLDGIPSPIYVRDLSGRLISCNRSYEQSLGMSFEQMNGRRLIDIDLIPRSIAQQLHADYIKMLETRQPIFADRSIELMDKTIDAWQWTVPFYRADGELQGLLGGWVDISELRQLQAQLQDAREETERVSDALMADMTRDVCTPLAVILGLLERELERAKRAGQIPSNDLEAAHQSVRLLLEKIAARDFAA